MLIKHIVSNLSTPNSYQQQIVPLIAQFISRISLLTNSSAKTTITERLISRGYIIVHTLYVISRTTSRIVRAVA